MKNSLQLFFLFFTLLTPPILNAAYLESRPYSPIPKSLIAQWTPDQFLLHANNLNHLYQNRFSLLQSSLPDSQKKDLPHSLSSFNHYYTQLCDTAKPFISKKTPNPTTKPLPQQTLNTLTNSFLQMQDLYQQLCLIPSNP